MAKNNTPLIIGISAAAILGIVALTASGTASAASHQNCFRMRTENDASAAEKKVEIFTSGIENDAYFALAGASSGSAISDTKLLSLMCDVAKKVPRLFAVSFDKAGLETLCPQILSDTSGQHLCSPKGPNDIKCAVEIFYKDQNGNVSEIVTDTFTTTEEGLKADILQSLKDNMVKPQPKPAPTPAYNPTDPYAPSASVCYTNGEPYNALLFPDAAGVVDVYRRIAGIKGDSTITPPPGYDFGDMDIIEVYKSDGLAKTPVFGETVNGGFTQDAAPSPVLQAFQNKAKQDGVYEAKVDGIIGECTMRALETVLVRAYTNPNA